MAAGGPNHDDGCGGMFAAINVTPMVDVTLVLLVIFMVAAPLIVANPSIKVALPKAATADETKRVHAGPHAGARVRRRLQALPRRHSRPTSRQCGRSCPDC